MTFLFGMQLLPVPVWADRALYSKAIPAALIVDDRICRKVIGRSATRRHRAGCRLCDINFFNNQQLVIYIWNYQKLNFHAVAGLSPGKAWHCPGQRKYLLPALAETGVGTEAASGARKAIGTTEPEQQSAVAPREWTALGLERGEHAVHRFDLCVEGASKVAIGQGVWHVRRLPLQGRQNLDRFLIPRQGLQPLSGDVFPITMFGRWSCGISCS